MNLPYTAQARRKHGLKRAHQTHNLSLRHQTGTFESISKINLSSTFHPSNKPRLHIKSVSTHQTVNKFWYALFSVLGIVMVAQLVASNTLASKGQNLGSLEKQSQLLTHENSSLREDLSSQTSLNTISQEAAKLGLTQEGTIVYLNVSDTYAASAAQ